MRHCPVCNNITNEVYCPSCYHKGLVLTLKIPSWYIYEAQNPELVAMNWCHFWLFSRIREG